MRYFLVTALLCFSSASMAATSTLSNPSTDMIQCSKGEVSALLFIHVANARLYRQHCQPQSELLTPPLILTFSYSRKVPADAFAKAAAHMIEKNIDAGLYKKLHDRIVAFNKGYRDTKDGDVWRLEYRTDQRLLLFFNKKQVASEKGQQFARAYLDIWFGSDPYSDSLKQSLLTDISHTGSTEAQ